MTAQPDRAINVDASGSGSHESHHLIQEHRFVFHQIPNSDNARASSSVRKTPRKPESGESDTERVGAGRVARRFGILGR